MKVLASRALNLAPSMTVAIDTKAKEMIAQGFDVVALGAGEPDFETPENIKEAAIRSIQEGKTRYTSPAGILAVKEAVVRKFSRENGLSYAPSQIVISSGAKHCVFNALLALVEPGDEVIITAPYWVTYPELVRFLGGVPVIINADLDADFRITPAQLEAAITPRTKLLILNSPCNPSGAVYPRETLQQLAKIVVEHDLYCITDEIYEHIIYSGHHVSIASLGQEIYNRSILINGVSKSYAMTGWRIGYLAAPQNIASAIAKIQGQSTHHPANVSQWAALEALDRGELFYTQMRKAFTERRNYFSQALQEIPGLEMNTPNGAFYAFPKAESFYGKKTPQGVVIKNSMDLCAWLLDSERLAIVPGAAFGMDGYIRLSYATSMDTLREAIKRLRAGLAALS